MSTNQQQLFNLFGHAKIYDLAHPIEAAMPVSPNHPGFKMALQRRHGDMVRADGGSEVVEHGVPAGCGKEVGTDGFPHGVPIDGLGVLRIEDALNVR